MGKHGHRISQEVIHVTNVQKAFCILLSMCFFATLAVLPGTFFTGENVYRHLPLYRFLEKRAHMSSYEDIFADSDIFADFTVFEGITVSFGTGVDSGICNSSDSPFSASNCSDCARSPRYFPLSGKKSSYEFL